MQRKSSPKLTQDTQSHKLEQLYKRAVCWKKRCEMRDAVARQEREEAELAECTFSPQVDDNSIRMLQVRHCSASIKCMMYINMPLRVQGAGRWHSDRLSRVTPLVLCL